MKKICSLLLLLSACGGEHNVHVNDVTVTHKILVDLRNLDQYFRPECARLFNHEEDIQKCIDDKIGDLLSKVAL